MRPLVKLAACVWGPVEPHRRRVVGWLAFALAAALMTTSRLDDLLSAMHGPDELSRGMADLGFRFDGPSVTNAQAALSAWARDPVASAESIARFHLLLDWVLVATFPLLAVVLLASARASASGWLKTVLAGGIGVALLAGVADAIENLGLGAVLGALDDEKPVAVSDGAYGLAFAAGAVKWVLIALTLAILVLAGVSLALRRARDLRSFGQDIVALRPLVLLVAVFAFLMFGPVAGPQAGDVMLRWVDEPSDAVAAVLGTLWLSGVTLSIGWLVLAQEEERPNRELDPTALLLTGGSLAVVGGALELLFDQGRGVWVLGVLLLTLAAIAKLGRPEGARPWQAPPRLQTVEQAVEQRRKQQLKANGPGAGAGAGEDQSRDMLPLLLAAAPVVLLGLALLRTSVTELAYLGDDRYRALVALGLTLQASGWWLVTREPERWGFPSPIASWLGRDLKTARLTWTGGIVVSGVASLVLAVCVWAAPQETAGVLGVVGAYAAFAVALSLGFLALLYLEQRRKPPAALVALGANRLPLLSVLVAWGLLGAVVTDTDYHDVRVKPAAGRIAGVRADVPEVWARWRENNNLPRVGRQLEPGRGGRRRAVPLVLVAASGGGARAAYWTAAALDCALDGEPVRGCERDSGAARTARERVLALSGISGGSVGLAAYTAHVVAGERSTSWVDDHLEQDALAPLWAWTLYADLPSSLLGLDIGPDRAEILEAAWERTWTDGDSKGDPLTSGVRELWATRHDFPLLLLSSTSVQDGCRLNVSVLDADIEPKGKVADRRCIAPAVPPEAQGTFATTEDVVDVLCRGDDLRLSTASLLSARYPFVAPSGRLPRCGRDDDAIYALDGGIFDNSAASPLLELWPQLERKVAAFNGRSATQCIVPVFLQIDNGYEQSVPPRPRRRPLELEAPVRAGLGIVGGARDASARQAAALAFGDRPPPGIPRPATVEDGRVEVDRYARLVPQSHPGTSAPLGWTLSKPSMQSLRNQLAADPSAERLRTTVSRWFDEGLQCAPPAGRAGGERP